MEQREEDSPMEKNGLLTSVFRNLRLAWRLVRDGRVPLWAKSVLAIGVAYLVFPLDFVPDYILGLGQLDDAGVALSCFKLFLSVCLSARNCPGASAADGCSGGRVSSGRGLRTRRGFSSLASASRREGFWTGIGDFELG